MAAVINSGHISLVVRLMPVRHRLSSDKPEPAHIVVYQFLVTDHEAGFLRILSVIFSDTSFILFAVLHLISCSHCFFFTGLQELVEIVMPGIQPDGLILEHFGMMDKKNGIIHVVGPERGLTLPGMTIVCGDSHTSTHGAMGAVAFGIGTSEVEMVMASQCILQTRPKTMRITVDGKLGKGVTAKDVALYMMSKMTTSGATGYFVEYAGEAVRSLSMEGRLTLCNLSIEMGARGGMVAPDETTFEYIKGREYTPKGEAWDKALAYWKTLKSDEDAVFDKEVRFDAADIEPMITYGTNPGMGMGITQHIPATEGMGEAAKASFMKSMEYMGFRPGEPLLGKKIDYVFLGACTNGRIEDFRAFASIVKGRRKAENVVAWLVPGSWMVDAQIREEGLDKILEEAGFAIRQPGCSACLAMNDDKVPAGKYAVSTSNRNFEGRQGPGSRTLLASPLVAAAAAVTGVITDPRTLI